MKRLEDFFKSRLIIARMAAKNAVLTLMHKSWYSKKMEEHLES
jgi:hypothetical protein